MNDFLMELGEWVFRQEFLVFFESIALILHLLNDKTHSRTKTININMSSWTWVGFVHFFRIFFGIWLTFEVFVSFKTFRWNAHPRNFFAPEDNSISNMEHWHLGGVHENCIPSIRWYLKNSTKSTYHSEFFFTVLQGKCQTGFDAFREYRNNQSKKSIYSSANPKINVPVAYHTKKIHFGIFDPYLGHFTRSFLSWYAN